MVHLKNKSRITHPSPGAARHPLPAKRGEGKDNRASSALRDHARRCCTAILLSAGALLLSACAHRETDMSALPLHDAQQLVVVTTVDWNATAGELRTFTRDGDNWHAASNAVPVTIGRTGSAWGIGLHPAQPGPVKREGDGRAPAGVFAIGTAFGYVDKAGTALPYAAMDANDWCIDVTDSPLYNRIVDARDVGEVAVAGSTEPMRRDIHANGDQRYKLGFVIEHNAAGTRGAGSCIFAHLWKAPGEATAGCTAMDEPTMHDLLAWLQPAQRPVFVLLPQGEYDRLKHEWNLPL
jgi:L,D-peptidoglycan transpeptidase YkuD (ErfK/YbiS/YcfS/YnhG family)